VYIVKKKLRCDIIHVIMFKNVARPTGYNKRRRRKNIPSWGAGKRGKLPACGKKPKEHLHPLKVCN
jgi:hypothetical protein